MSVNECGTILTLYNQYNYTVIELFLVFIAVDNGHILQQQALTLRSINNRSVQVLFLLIMVMPSGTVYLKLLTSYSTLFCTYYHPVDANINNLRVYKACKILSIHAFNGKLLTTCICQRFRNVLIQSRCAKTFVPLLPHAYKLVQR